MLEDIIKTTVKPGYAEITEKKSRFIAHTRPVKSEEEARAFIEEIKKKYYDARHNVFAYQIGEKNELKRFSDDGEPQGTAGMPVLSVLSSEDIKNTAVVVTRYFGGILLGTGGLVRAYTAAAKAGLDNAGVCQIGLYKKYSVECDYTQSGKIQYELSKGEYFVENTDFTDKVTYTVYIENSRADIFEALITEITSGSVQAQLKDTLRGACTEEGFKLYE